MSSDDSGNSFLQDFLNFGLNVSTGGIVGFEADKGGVGGGVTTGIVKDVTGATAAEEANALARDKFEQEKDLLAQDRQTAIDENATRQLNASNAAGANRTGTKRAVQRKNSTASKLGGAKDFLGL